ncbi:MAG: tRNA (cytidine(34)-2'-O)-methyltransferase [Pseudomonadota bacterium]
MSGPCDVVLHQPEIPPNTGNIIRLCANTGAGLHLIEPLGFDLDDTRLRRAGLDYHEWARVTVHADWAACADYFVDRRMLALTTRGQTPFHQVAITPEDVLVFGSETAGLPDAILETIPGERWLRLPLRPGNRSMNLSNSVAVCLYEAWRQQDFPGAEL